MRKTKRSVLTYLVGNLGCMECPFNRREVEDTSLVTVHWSMRCYATQEEAGGRFLRRGDGVFPRRASPPKWCPLRDQDISVRMTTGFDR